MFIKGKKFNCETSTIRYTTKKNSVWIFNDLFDRLVFQVFKSKPKKNTAEESNMPRYNTVRSL